MRPAAALVAIALLATLPGQAVRTAAAQPLQAGFAQVPEALVEQFAAATAAQDSFNAADARLSQAFADGRSGVPAAPDAAPATLRRESLGAFLRPWDYSIYRNYADASRSAPGRFPADVLALLAEERARESARWESMPKEMRAEAKANLPPQAAEPFVQALERWLEYRRLTCELVDRYLQQRAAAAEPPGETSTDRLCMTAFTNNLQRDAGDILRSHARAVARPGGDLPVFVADGAKFHYLGIHSAEKSQSNHQRQSVHVTITDASAPLIVMLHAYEPIEWSIQLGKGVKMRQIVLYGHYKPTFRFNGPTAPVRTYSEEEGNHEQIWKFVAGGQAARLELRDALTEMTGIAPETMQFDACLKDTCLIDGERSSLQYQSSRASRARSAHPAEHRTHRFR